MDAKCGCALQISLHHIVHGCPALPAALSPLWNLRESHALATEDFLTPHPDLGTRLMVALADAIQKADLAKWF